MVETKTSICLILAETREFEITLVYAIILPLCMDQKSARLRSDFNRNNRQIIH